MAFRRQLGPVEVEQRWAEGVQELLVIGSVPAGAEALIGQFLKGQQITIAGAYTCYIHMAGMNQTEVHLMATNNSGTMPTTSGGTLYQDQATQKSPFTGVGLMVSATRQTLGLASGVPKGEKIAAVIITLPAASSCTFTQAEYNGMRA